MKRLFYMLMALPILLVACNSGDENPAPQPAKPELTLTSEQEVEFTAEGGEGTITYNYTAGDIVGKDEISGDIATLKIDCEAEWIDIEKEVAPLGNIDYTVAKNTSTEARQATITATLNDLSFSVTVKQAAATDTPEPEPTIEGWGIVGTMNEWDVTTAIMMTEIDGYHVAEGVELSIDDRFKFIKDGDSTYNRGGNGQAADPDYFYVAQSWGSDIHVSEAGTFDIYLNAKENTYYIMTEGKSPAEALEPLAPGENLYEAYGNFEGAESVRLTNVGKYKAAKGVTFSTTTAELVICMNTDEKVYGAKESATYAIDEAIALAEGDTKVVVSVQSGVKYDIYYRNELSTLWLMPEGMTPVIWEEITGVVFSSTNYGVFLIAEDFELMFDFYTPESQNNIIPEGTYYVTKEDGSSDFNFDAEYLIRVNGAKTYPKDGTMEIKHIAGGYDITVDMTTIHNHVIKAHYAGPIGELAMIGQPITNP